MRDALVEHVSLFPRFFLCLWLRAGRRGRDAPAADGAQKQGVRERAAQEAGASARRAPPRVRRARCVAYTSRLKAAYTHTLAAYMYVCMCTCI